MDKDFRKTAVDGFELLENNKFYSQVSVINKLETLGVSISATTFNRILKDGPVGLQTLSAVAKGIQLIVEKELGYKMIEGAYIEDEIPSNEKEIIEEKIDQDRPTGFKFHKDGRLSIEEKVAFMSSAQEEIIEFGVTLNTFTSYFYNRKPKEFKEPIISLLRKGVNLKCFLLDPNSNAARFYFEDRKKIQLDEEGEEKIKKSIRRLKVIKEEINSLSLKGHMEIYTYRYVPNNYFLAIDRENTEGEMMVSHYLFGEKRADCPVLEFTKKYQQELFRLYNRSLSNLIDKAKIL